MKNKYLLITALLFILNITTAISQVKIIFDTDFGGDADDLGALAMLHNFVDKGECDLLAIMSWSTETYAVSAIDAVNRFYKHPDIPIGSRKDPLHDQSWNYTRPIAESFKYALTNDDVPDATILYRRILADCEDNSVVIVTVGPLKNIQNLIQSGPDTYSNLSGKELIEKKVKEFSIMGGKFPACDNEWNFDGAMPGVTKFVIDNITVPITFSGFEVGFGIKTGEVFNNIDPGTPLYVGFMHFSENAPWIKEHFKGKILDNASYDQTAVLYAVRGGTGTYWDKIAGNECIPDNQGGNTWIENKDSNHTYLRLILLPEEMATLIESIMLNTF